MSFINKLKLATERNSSYVCVGLDPRLDKIPAFLSSENDPIYVFNKAIIDATFDKVCAYKPNIAFFEQYGLKGLEALKKTLEYIPSDVPVILDAKRSDIGYTAGAYARAVFEEWKADAVTVNPLLGWDSVEPFVRYEDKGVFLLGLTSNPGADDFEKLEVCSKSSNSQLSKNDGQSSETCQPLFLKIAEKVNEWNTFGNCGLVVGATQGEQMQEVRKVFSNGWFLIPGIGAQGGDLEMVIKSTSYSLSDPRIIINASRSILYASGEKNFASESAKAATKLSTEIISLLG